MDDIPEEDKHLTPTRQTLHKHEWVDLYGGSGFVKGYIERALQAFFCKWCLKIRVVEWDQRRYNLNSDVELNDPDDGATV